MDKWRCSGLSVLVGLALACFVQAQNITDFENGYLTFTNGNPDLYYRIESRPNLDGPEDWDGGHSGWKNIQTNAATITVPAGIYYRVVGSSNPVDVGTAEPGDILASKTVYVNGQIITGSLYTITYHLNGGYNNSSNIMWYTPENETFALYDPEKPGAPFEGWYTNGDYSGDVVASVLSGASGDLAFYARWGSNVFDYTGMIQVWAVPLGVTNVLIECWGAQAGFGSGAGAYAKGERAVVPHELLYVYIGGSAIETNGGWNGGGDGGSASQYGVGGGGASDVRVGGTAYEDRIIVAGGGGGHAGPYGYGYGEGGDGGATSGAAGTDGDPVGAGSGTGGGGGGPSSGGSGGSCCSGLGTSGSFGEGGNGGTPDDGYGGGGGGGGGGGWYGGGGGGGGASGDGGGGGGGGSSYIGGVTNAIMQSGVNTTYGRVVISPL